jgi:hypothetical protein
MHALFFLALISQRFIHENLNHDSSIQLLTAAFNYYLPWNEEFEYNLLLIVDGAYQLIYMYESPSPSAVDTFPENFAVRETNARPCGKLVVM